MRFVILFLLFVLSAGQASAQYNPYNKVIVLPPGIVSLAVDQQTEVLHALSDAYYNAYALGLKERFGQVYAGKDVESHLQDIFGQLSQSSAKECTEESCRPALMAIYQTATFATLEILGTAEREFTVTYSVFTMKKSAQEIIEGATKICHNCAPGQLADFIRNLVASAAKPSNGNSGASVTHTPPKKPSDEVIEGNKTNRTPKSPARGLFEENQTFSTLPDGLILQEKTGLIWQAEDDGSVHTFDDAVRYCKNLNTAGYSDWRLPTTDEFFSITDHNLFKPAAAAALSLRSSGSRDAGTGRYWTGETDNAEQAWFMSFEAGVISKRSKNNNYFVRCVRGIPLLKNPHKYEKLSDGSILQLATGLIWAVQDMEKRVDHSTATGLCSYSKLHGKSDWRLPTLKELASLLNREVKTNNSDPVLNMSTADYYWSSDIFANSSRRAWYVFFKNGLADRSDRSFDNLVRCVRSEK